MGKETSFVCDSSSVMSARPRVGGQMSERTCVIKALDGRQRHRDRAHVSNETVLFYVSLVGCHPDTSRFISSISALSMNVEENHRTDSNDLVLLRSCARGDGETGIIRLIRLKQERVTVEGTTLLGTSQSRVF